MVHKKIGYFLGLLLVFNQRHIVSSAQSSNYSFESIITQKNLDKYSTQLQDLINKSQVLQKETSDDEILDEIEHNIQLYSQHLISLQNMPEQYKKDKESIEKTNDDVAVLDSALKSNLKQYKNNVEELMSSMPLFELEYQGVQSKIALKQAEQNKQKAKIEDERNKAQAAEEKARKDLADVYEQELQKFNSIISLLQEEVKSREQLIQEEQQDLSKIQKPSDKKVVQKVIEDNKENIEKIKQKQSELKEQQETIKKELKKSETESLTKEFMDYVAENYSAWLKDLPDNKQVLQDDVKHVLGENFTNAQVLYSQGFLQALKL